ncbi:hypothetical protein HHI36_002133 [Cryptolaemus montrouzieri]|uniref:Uncharacterized protein n=1 Tax=Cryptolaemus montrouzieri TaxID=559131 RepID=A0ABD2PAB8_9CUCU
MEVHKPTEYFTSTQDVRGQLFLETQKQLFGGRTLKYNVVDPLQRAQKKVGVLSLKHQYYAPFQQVLASDLFRF